MASSLGSGELTVNHSSLLNSAFGALLHTAAFPWHLSMQGFAWLAAMLLNTLRSLGAPPPPGYIEASKLRELTAINHHMHTREDVYRRAIRELQEELDAKDSDRKKALRKLRSTRDEISGLNARLAQLQEAYCRSENGVGRADFGSGGDSRRQKGGGGSAAAMVHATFAALVGAIWWFSKLEHTSLHSKLAYTIFFPLLWMYASWFFASNKRGQVPLMLLIPCWFHIGFLIALSVGESQPGLP